MRGLAVKYLMLIYGNEQVWNSVDADGFAKLVAEEPPRSRAFKQASQSRSWVAMAVSLVQSAGALGAGLVMAFARSTSTASGGSGFAGGDPSIVLLECGC
jgi:hypothetical protein